METLKKVLVALPIIGLFVWGYLSPQSLIKTGKAILGTVLSAIMNTLTAIISIVFDVCFRGKNQFDQICYSIFLVGLVVGIIFFARWVFKKKVP